MRRLAVVLAGALLAFQAACVPDVKAPEVELVGARLSSMGLDGGIVDVELSVYNPNRFGLEASGLTYDLDVEDPQSGDWLDFTEGTLHEDVRVGSGETVTVVVPVEFTFQTLGNIARVMLDRGAFEYRVSGDVAVEEPLRRSIGYRHTGEVTPSGVR